MNNSAKPHLYIATRSSDAGPRLDAQSDDTFDWFRRTILKLIDRNHKLSAELIFYRNVCQFLTLLIVLAIAAAVLIHAFEIIREGL